MILKKNGARIVLENEIQIAAYKNSGWVEAADKPKKDEAKENKKTEE